MEGVDPHVVAATCTYPLLPVALKHALHADSKAVATNRTEVGLFSTLVWCFSDVLKRVVVRWCKEGSVDAGATHLNDGENADVGEVSDSR